MLSQRSDALSSLDLAALSARTHTFESFGRTLAGMMLHAASRDKASPEMAVPTEATLRLVPSGSGGVRIIGCICVTAEGCPCVDFGDLFDWDLPPRTPESPPIRQLSAHDHTNVVTWVTENPIRVLAEVGMRGRREATVTPIEVLEALSRIDEMDRETKDAVQSSLAILRSLQGVRLPRDAQAAVDEVVSQINEQDSVEGMIAVLTKLARSSSVKRTPGLAESLKVALDILGEGAGTIYDPGSSPSVVYKSASDDASDVAGADVAGGVAVGVGAAVSGLVGGPVVSAGAAAAGAAAGAIGNSAAKVVEKIWDWLF